MIIRSAKELARPPQRIISLVPSLTELLHYLGLEQETVGLTKFCIHPTLWYRTKTRVGGTKTLRLNIIHNLQPDLIIANKEENVKEQIEELARDYPVWVTDVNDFKTALQMIKDIGTLTGKLTEATQLTAAITRSFSRLKKLKTQNAKPKTAYLIWRNPYMAVGNNTFINDILHKCGFENIFSDIERYPEITISQLQTAGCQLLLLSSEPWPFKEKHIAELQSQLPDCKIMLADGEMFSWYGSRLLEAVPYFAKLIKNIS